MLEIFNVIFSDEVLAGELHEVLFRNLKAYSAVFTGPEFFAMEAEFRRLWSEANESRLGHELVIEGSLERILIDLARKCLVAKSSVEHDYISCQHKGIQKALIYIHHHFRESLTLRDAAAHAHLSPNYFSECFHRVTGSPFQVYLQGLRLRFAMSLLHVSELSMTDICYASGFKTLSHFERAFKRRFGRPPGAYAAGRVKHKDLD
jgi:AraC-like DNA-binding protein